MHRRNSLLLLFFAFPMAGCTVSPESPKDSASARGEATWNYWQGLLKGQQALDAAFVLEFPLIEDPVARHMEKARLMGGTADRLEAIALELERLPVLNVDSEALDIGSTLLKEVRERHTLLNKVASVFRGSGEGTSAGTKGLSQLMEQASALNEDRLKRQERLRVEIRRARITLTQRYNKEFPDLQ